MSELPKGWEQSPLSTFFQFVRGVSYKKDEAGPAAAPKHLPVLRANNIDSDRLIFGDLVFVPENRVSDIQRIKKHDVVIAMSSGSKKVVGKTAQAMNDWEGGFGAFCGVLRPTPLINEKYFGYFTRTKQYRNQISNLAAGTNINNIKQGYFDEIILPLPPLNEQHRIVKKLDLLLPKVEACKERLDNIPAILKRFRQSVLSAACSGDLTEDWRIKNKNLSPSHNIIEELNTPNPKKHLNVFVETSEKEIPESWCYTPFGKLGSFASGGTPSKSKAEYWGGSFPWVSPKDMKVPEINDSQDHITEKALAEAKIKVVPKNSVLVVIRGMILNHTFPIALAGREVTINQDMKAILIEEPINPQYIFLALRSRSLTVLNYVKEATHGTRRIETDLLKNIAIPVPPVEEQREIVRRANELFSIADDLEDRFKSAQDFVQKLSESILAKAFRGELISQNPKDEPASVLLEKLKEQRESKSSSRKQKRKTDDNSKRRTKKKKAVSDEKTNETSGSRPSEGEAKAERSASTV